MPQRRYCIEAVVFITYVLFSLTWVAASLMTREVMESFGIGSYTQATWATNAVTTAKILGNFLAAWLLVRLGIRKAFLTASALIAAGAIGAFAGQYSFFVFSRLLMGLGGAVILVYFNPIVVRYFTRTERTLVNGFNSAAFNVGSLFAVLCTFSLLAWFGSWQKVLLLFSGCSFLLFCCAVFVLEDFSPATGNPADAPERYGIRDGLKEPVIWFLPLTNSGFLFCYLSVFSLFPLIPDFPVPADRLAAVLVAGGVVGSAACVPFMRRFPLRLPIIRYAGLLVTLATGLTLSVTTPVLAYAMAFIAGFFMYFPLPALYSVGQELPGMTPAKVTVVFSIFWSVVYSIVTVLMPIAGLIADTTGSVRLAAFFAVACSLTFFFGSFLLPETGKKTALP